MSNQKLAYLLDFAMKDFVCYFTIQTLGGAPSDFFVYSNERYLRKTFLNGTKLEDLHVSNGSVRGFDFDARCVSFLVTLADKSLLALGYALCYYKYLNQITHT